MDEQLGCTVIVVCPSLLQGGVLPAKPKVITKVLESIYPLHDSVVAIEFKKRGLYGDLIKRIEEGTKVLEVGCGTGRLLENLCGKARAVGLDISLKFLKIAKERLEKCGIDLVYGTATNLPFRSNAFDYVITYTMMHHLTSDEKVQSIKEIGRVGKVYLFGEVGKELCWSALLLRLIGSKGLLKRKHIEKAGLKVIEWRDVGQFCLVHGLAK